MKQLLSPKQVAASIGVSESSLKRWCDQGVIPIERTPGGHRRIRLCDAVQFARSRSTAIVQPDQIGLPPGIDGVPTRPDESIDPLTAALNQGATESARSIVFSCYLNGASLADICDNLLSPAMHRLGLEWQCGQLEVFQERRACEVVNLLLFELRSMAPLPQPSGPIALGGSPEGDQYRLATIMVELTLREAGWNATSLGSSLPLETITSAVKQHRPRLVWLSLSNPTDDSELSERLQVFRSSIPENVSLVVGGQALSERVAADLEGVLCCDNLSSLQELSESLLPQSPAVDGGV